MIEAHFKADVSGEGRILKIIQRASFDTLLRSYSGKSIKISVSEWKKKRSLPQLRYYWGSLIFQVQDALVANGYPKSELDAETIHEYLKQRFLKKELVSEESGEVMQITRSTSSLSTLEMSEYFEDIFRWSAEYLNTVIVAPNEQAEINLH